MEQTSWCSKTSCRVSLALRPPLYRSLEEAHFTETRTRESRSRETPFRKSHSFYDPMDVPLLPRQLFFLVRLSAIVAVCTSFLIGDTEATRLLPLNLKIPLKMLYLRYKEKSCLRFHRVRMFSIVVVMQFSSMKSGMKSLTS